MPERIELTPELLAFQERTRTAVKRAVFAALEVASADDLCICVLGCSESPEVAVKVFTTDGIKLLLQTTSVPLQKDIASQLLAMERPQGSISVLYAFDDQRCECSLFEGEGCGSDHLIFSSVTSREPSAEMLRFQYETHDEAMLLIREQVLQRGLDPAAHVLLADSGEPDQARSLRIVTRKQMVWLLGSPDTNMEREAIYELQKRGSAEYIVAFYMLTDEWAVGRIAIADASATSPGGTA